MNEQITIPNRKSCALSEIYHKVIKNFNANRDCFNISGKNRYSLLTWKLNTQCVFLSRLLLRPVFAAGFPGVVPLGSADLFISGRLQSLVTGKPSGVDPGRPG